MSAQRFLLGSLVVSLFASSAFAQNPSGTGNTEGHEAFVKQVGEYAEKMKEKIGAEVEKRTPEQKERWGKLGVAAGESYIVYRGLRNRAKAKAQAKGVKLGTAQARAAAQLEIDALKAELEVRTVTGRAESAIKNAIEAKLGGPVEAANANGGRPLVRVVFVDASEMEKSVPREGLALGNNKNIITLVQVEAGQTAVTRTKVRGSGMVMYDEVVRYEYGVDVKVTRVAQWGSVANFDTKGVDGFVNEIAEATHAGVAKQMHTDAFKVLGDLPPVATIGDELRVAMKTAEVGAEAVASEVRFAAKAAAQAVEATGEVATQTKIVQVIRPVSAEEAAVRKSWWQTSVTGNSLRLGGALMRKIPKFLWIYSAGDVGYKCYKLAETGDSGGWSPLGPEALDVATQEIPEACVNLWSTYGWGGTYYQN